MADEAPEPIRNIEKVRKFVVGTDFEAYAEQLELFFVANSVTGVSSDRPLSVDQRDAANDVILLRK